MKLNEMVRDLPSLKSKMEKIDKNRVARLKSFREEKAYKGMLSAWIDNQSKPKILSDKQRMAIALMVDFVHNYTNEYVATRLDININTLGSWRNDPLFISEMDKEITRRKSFMRVHAFRNIHRAIARGSLKDSWQYLKLTGDLKENVNHIIDPTGERELSDDELKREIAQLSKQLVAAHEPSTS